MLALHTGADLPVAGWLFSIFLLRFTRSSKPLTGLLWVLGVNVVGTLVWCCTTGLLFSLPVLFAFLFLAVLASLPYVLDRLLAHRFGWLLGSLLFPLGRVAAEYGFQAITDFGNYGSLAATQYGSLPLLQLATVTGSYGVSFLIAWLASIANVGWERKLLRPVLVYSSVLVTVLGLGAARMSWTAPNSPTVRVAGISPESKTLQAVWSTHSQAAFETVNAEMIARTKTEARAGAKIVVWSEESGYATKATETALIDRVRQVARTSGIYVDMHLNVVSDRAPLLRNKAILLTPTGQVGWDYEKAHPTPQEASEGMVDGGEPAPTLMTPYGRIGTLICYDLDFPALAGKANADILLVPANDWSGFADLHAQLATIRAIEDGTSIVREASNGVATVTDFQGRTIAYSDYSTNASQTLVADVPTRSAATIYRLFGDLFAWLCLVALLVLVLISRRSARPGRRQSPPELDSLPPDATKSHSHTS
ncbi:nitrilase-related carbon-nitrogen hydrolase [Fodinicola feengrottensis]|uniref:nitrilase-related carbon-nitrogen hydrolase n=1 Tax=Fodinicola feengrottensis TaxID=435914 RepID=UPI0013D6361F|nr:nitrilase-related carbon-nitrogen hydrolase [Fodinicola feengrottensis]